MRDDDLNRQGARNSLEGNVTDVKGKVKDGVGGLTGDSSLQGEGKLDQLKGKAQDALGDIQRKLGGSDKA